MLHVTYFVRGKGSLRPHICQRKTEITTNECVTITMPVALNGVHFFPLSQLVLLIHEHLWCEETYYVCQQHHLGKQGRAGLTNS